MVGDFNIEAPCGGRFDAGGTGVCFESLHDLVYRFISVAIFSTFDIVDRTHVHKVWNSTRSLDLFLLPGLADLQQVYLAAWARRPLSRISRCCLKSRCRTLKPSVLYPADRIFLSWRAAGRIALLS